MPNQREVASVIAAVSRVRLGRTLRLCPKTWSTSAGTTPGTARVLAPGTTGVTGRTNQDSYESDDGTLERVLVLFRGKCRGAIV